MRARVRGGCDEGTLLPGHLVTTVEEDIGGGGGGYTETLRRSAKKKKNIPGFLRRSAANKQPISGSYFVAANAAHIQLAPESSPSPNLSVVLSSNAARVRAITPRYPSHFRQVFGTLMPCHFLSPRFKYGRRSVAASARTKSKRR